MHSLVKEQKKSIFTVPFLGPSGGTKNETAKSQNQQQRPTRPNKNYNCGYLSKKHIDLEQRRPAHAKPDFNWLSAPKNGTWKRTCGISCLRSLAPMWRLQCSTTQATYNTRIKFFLLTSYSNLTGLIWITWRIADQLLCFEIILLHSDLKYAGHAKWG